jgi:hypothetical protein
MHISIRGIVRGTVDQVVGLVVDDGFVAVGAVVALLLTGWLAAAEEEAILPHDALGVFLFVTVSLFLLGSIARAGRAAQAHAASARPSRDMAGEPAD